MAKRSITDSDGGHNELLEETKKNKSEPGTQTRTLKKKTLDPIIEIQTFTFEDFAKYAQQYYTGLELKDKNFDVQQRNLIDDLIFIVEREKLEPRDFLQLEKYLFRPDSTEAFNAFCNGINVNTLSILMFWKMMRGKYRPRLSALIKENTGKQTIEATKSCFKELFDTYEEFKKVKSEGVPFIDTYRKEIKKWLKTLCSLHGVGPATASAIMTMINPEIPFMSDEGLAASGDLKPAYNYKTFNLYLNFVSSALRKVNVPGTEKMLSGRDIERSIFTFSMTKQYT